MKNIKDYIIEGRTVDTVKIKTKKGKELEPVWYAYDEESLDNLLKKVKYTSQYWIDKGIYLSTLKNKSSWEVDMDDEYNFHIYQPGADFFYCDDNEESYTRQEILDLFDKEETMIVVLNK